MTSVPPPICLDCKHFRNMWTCDAFPERIPQAIIESEHDHRKPFPGDHGIRFEPLANVDDIPRPDDPKALGSGS